MWRKIVPDNPDSTKYFDYDASDELLRAARIVLADLNERMDEATAKGEPVPVFRGHAALHVAISKAEGA